MQLDHCCAVSLNRLGRLQHLSSFNVLEFLHRSGWPSDLDQLHSGIATQTNEQPLVTRRKVTDRRVDGKILSQSGGRYYFHPASNPVAVRFRADGLDPDPVV